MVAALLRRAVNMFLIGILIRHNGSHDTALRFQFEFLDWERHIDEKW